MIKPTVGRVVWFFPTAAYMRSRHLVFSDQSQPLAATIVYVHNDRMVNLVVSDQSGAGFGVSSVELVQEGVPVPAGSFYCTWMPYQKGQAAKTESLERQVADAAKCLACGESHGATGLPCPNMRVVAQVPGAGEDKLSSWRSGSTQGAGVGACAGIHTTGQLSAGAMPEPKQPLMVRMFLNRGSIVKVNGIPLELDHDVVVKTHPENVPLLGNRGRAKLAPAAAMLLASADCCDTNAAARDDLDQADQDLTNAASYRLAASLLQA
ncbi:hypothetical protein OSS47_28280 [Pseudomonas citronellolis]|uniref:hypothetical protein n=1 Tax=Pseudomonas TaxID=286 RepID=UPI00226F250A|nr:MULTISPECIES: hypothetical protein [Pseudomonas]MED5607793.1 hypothetical protein [Pseudomonas sp. JH-2]WAB91967.1 hypothetical protein OSS47_28280 [Pseudomonas citronellolis]